MTGGGVIGAREPVLTEDDDGLLGGILLGLRLRIAVLVDDIGCVSDDTKDGQVSQAPDPAESAANLAGLSDGGLVRVGSAEGDAASGRESHRGIGGRRTSSSSGDGRSLCISGDAGKGSRGDAVAGGVELEASSGHSRNAPSRRSHHGDGCCI